MGLSDEEKLQAAIAELRILEAYYNEVAARESLLGKAMLENRAAIESVKGLPEDSESELLVPIGGGLFIHSKAQPIEKLVVSLGADVAIEKTREEALAFLEQRLSEFEKAAAALVGQRNELARKIGEARAAIGAFVEKQRQA